MKMPQRLLTLAVVVTVLVILILNTAMISKLFSVSTEYHEQMNKASDRLHLVYKDPYRIDYANTAAGANRAHLHLLRKNLNKSNATSGAGGAAAGGGGTANGGDGDDDNMSVEREKAAHDQNDTPEQEDDTVFQREHHHQQKQQQQQQQQQQSGYYNELQRRLDKTLRWYKSKRTALLNADILRNSINTSDSTLFIKDLQHIVQKYFRDKPDAVPMRRRNQRLPNLKTIFQDYGM